MDYNATNLFDGGKNYFQTIAKRMENLFEDKTPWLDSVPNNAGDSLPGSSDIVFIPYLKMNEITSFVIPLCCILITA